MSLAYRFSTVPNEVFKRIRNGLIYFSVILILLLLSISLYKGGVRFKSVPISPLSLGDLPVGLLSSFLRLALAYFISLILAFLLGFPAARTHRGEKLILPLLDIFQSVPVVGFFPAAVALFVGFVSADRMAVEAAAVFLLVMGQVWQLAFTVYETTKSIPRDHIDAIASFGVIGSASFWRLYAPSTIPRMVYSSILAWSKGWFLLVACEIIAVGPISYYLPGIGSFLARAAESDRVGFVLLGLIALTLVIFLIDLLLWRPASEWADRYKQDSMSEVQIMDLVPKPEYSMAKWMPVIVPAKKVLRALFFPLIWFLKEVLLPIIWDLPISMKAVADSFLYKMEIGSGAKKGPHWIRSVGRIFLWAFEIVTAVFALRGAYLFFLWSRPPWPELISEIPRAIEGSTARLLIAMVLSLMTIVPIVIAVWDRPLLRRKLSTLAQVAASLPAIALFPLIVFLIVRKLGLSMQFASIVLLLAGMQWYLLFSCMGATSQIPGDIVDAARSLGLTRYRQWNKVVLPSMRPALITGAISAWGGGWNALIVAEYVNYRGHIISVRGIGSLLSRAVYESVDSRATTFCMISLVIWIIGVNLLFWQPLYRRAIERYRFDAQ